jgi:hypothetical protein
METQDDTKMKNVPPRYGKRTAIIEMQITMMRKMGCWSIDIQRLTLALSGAPPLMQAKLALLIGGIT